MEKVTLYNRDAAGRIRIWSIEPQDDGLLMEYGLLDGEITTQFEDVPEGKSTRDIVEQIESRMNSRINKKLDVGYVRTLEEAKSRKQVLNALGLPKPMLAHRIDKVNDVDYEGSVIQYKYDGHRCLITNEGGEIKAYSRSGKWIDTIHEIIESVSIPEGMILDGELYLHGKPLNTITSLIKRRQEGTENLVYICYDVMLDECYSDRLSVIETLSKYWGDNIQVAPILNNCRESEIPGLLDEAIESGYEGLILRQPGYFYEDNKRSKGLIKIKKFLESDFEISDIKQSREGWAILTCLTSEGKEFDVSAPGDFQDKHWLWIKRGEYIGRKVNVKYSNITSYGIPFHPVATRIVENL